MTAPTLLHGKWEQPDGFREAYDIWANAWDRMESFDQFVMSGRRPENGHAVPANSAEQREGAAHARKVTAEAERLTAHACPDKATRDSAKRAALHAHERRVYIAEQP